MNLHPKSFAGLAFAFLPVLALSISVARAATPDNTEDRLVDLRLQWHTSQAERQTAAFENRISFPAVPSADDIAIGHFQNPQILLDRLSGNMATAQDGLITDFAKLNRPLDDLTQSVKKAREQAEAKWRAAYRHRVAFAVYAGERQSSYGFELAAKRQPPPLALSIFDIAMILWTFVSFFLCSSLAAHELRVARRHKQLTRPLAAAAVGIMALVPLSLQGCGFFGSQESEAKSWVAKEEEQLPAQSAAAASETAALRESADQKWNKIAEVWTRRLNAPHAARNDVAEQFRQGSVDLRGKIRFIANEANLAERLSMEAEVEQAKLNRNNPDGDWQNLNQLVSQAKVRSYIGAIARSLMAAGLLGIALLPIIGARRKLRQSLRKESRLCPRCLAVDKLKVTCTDVQDNRYPEPDYVECQECQYKFRKSYLKLPRLCFPTVGIRASGKTNMLVTAYDRVRNGLAPTSATLQRAPSLGDNEFEAEIDNVIRDLISPAPTMHYYLPYPVMLHVNDSDPVEPSSVLVNLFDYGGEMVMKTIDADVLRRRAVMMDGFMLFLDPTQLYGRGQGGMRIEDQIKALDSFFQDMREQRKINVGQTIPVPVAVCISKFDLLVSDNPIRGQSVPFIRKLLGELSPSGPLTIAEVQARSTLIEQMLPLMLPGIDFRRMLQGYFGNQIMFFPMSSLSLNEKELGIKDRRLRTMAPFGVVEPCLWLLHMHGYRVLG